MAAKSTLFDTALLTLIFNNSQLGTINELMGVASSPQTDLYISLHTATPAVGAPNQTTNEISYTGYARAAVPRSAFGFTVAGNVVSLTSNVDFAPCSGGASQTATHFAIGTKSTGAAGIILYFGAITPNIVVSSGVIPRLTPASTVTET